MGDLTGRQVERLAQALQSAYDLSSMKQLVAYKFQPPDGTPTPVPPAGAFLEFTEGIWSDRVLMLIEKAEREGWTDALVREAHLRVPGNHLLRQFHQEYFASVQRQVPASALQRVVSASASFLQPAVWREKLAALEQVVCAIEYADEALGTGFLVAPDVVLTNHHVMADAIATPAAAASFAARFDFKRLGNAVLSPGKVHRLHQQWHLASSPASAADGLVDPASRRDPNRGEPKSQEPSTSELDYCFVRLQDEAGADRVNDGPRGFVPSPAAQTLTPQSTLHVLQHPYGRPLALALGVEAIVRVNAGGTRVRYRTDTEPGSSGAPCFDQNWALIALHHSGDPDFSRSADYNEGIPIDAIRQHVPAALRAELGW